MKNRQMEMRKTSVYIILFLFWIAPAWASYQAQNLREEASAPMDAGPVSIFLSEISTAAEQFIGMPVQYGGRPSSTGTTDNSSLFYTIYTTAAQNAGLSYNSAYLPMKYLMKNMMPIDPGEVRNGDLIVLDNTLAAMIYRVELSGRMHFIYASKKRQQVISFHTGNIVYQVYWLEHLNGFFRLKKNMLQPAR